MATDPPQDAERPLIAVVDDEPAIRGVATRFLEPAGYRIIFDETADDAIALRFGDPEPAVLLLDPYGPIDCFSKGEAVVEIRRRELAESRRRLPIAIQSGSCFGPGAVHDALEKHPGLDPADLAQAAVADWEESLEAWRAAHPDPAGDEPAEAIIRHETAVPESRRVALAECRATIESDEYLYKPPDVRNFLETVERLIALGTARRV